MEKETAKKTGTKSASAKKTETVKPKTAAAKPKSSATKSTASAKPAAKSTSATTAKKSSAVKPKTAAAKPKSGAKTIVSSKSGVKPRMSTAKARAAAAKAERSAQRKAAEKKSAERKAKTENTDTVKKPATEIPVAPQSEINEYKPDESKFVSEAETAVSEKPITEPVAEEKVTLQSEAENLSENKEVLAEEPVLPIVEQQDIVSETDIIPQETGVNIDESNEDRVDETPIAEENSEPTLTEDVIVNDNTDTVSIDEQNKAEPDGAPASVIVGAVNKKGKAPAYKAGGSVFMLILSLLFTVGFALYIAQNISAFESILTANSYEIAGGAGTFINVLLQAFVVIGLWLVYFNCLAEKKSAAGVGFIRFTVAYDFIVKIIVLSILLIVAIMLIAGSSFLNLESLVEAIGIQGISPLAVSIFIAVVIFAAVLIEAFYYSSLRKCLKSGASAIKSGEPSTDKGGKFAAVIIILRALISAGFTAIIIIYGTQIADAICNVVKELLAEIGTSGVGSVLPDAETVTAAIKASFAVNTIVIASAVISFVSQILGAALMLGYVNKPE